MAQGFNQADGISQNQIISDILEFNCFLVLLSTTKKKEMVSSSIKHLQCLFTYADIREKPLGMFLRVSHLSYVNLEKQFFVSRKSRDA